MKNIKLTITCILFSLFINLSAQEVTQTIRGTILDQDSKVSIIGANVIVTGIDGFFGSSTNIDGKFKIEKVPVGRVGLKISCIGFEDRVMPNILLGSGKEVVLDIELQESFITLSEAVIVAHKNKAKSLNTMSSISSKTFTTDETNRYSGSLNDPARMVSAYAGVAGDAEGNNDIVVRGNSPRGIRWRLEGVDIPNPNHFANDGSTGGPVNSLNGSMLANSDFFSGAFAPEYGDALSGIFDVKFRKGNNEKREYAFSLGVIGTDFTMEGPFKKGYNGSYLFNYRYSSLDLLTSAGILDFGGVPKYQDASFKISLPTKKHGEFSLFGLGGLSSISQKVTDEEGDIEYGSGVMDAYLGVIGLNHSYQLSNKAYIKSSLSSASNQSGFTAEALDSRDDSYYTAMHENLKENKIKASTMLNSKIDSRNRIQTGIILTNISYNLLLQTNMNNSGPTKNILDTKGNANMVQAFTSWRHRLYDDLTIVSGLHYTQFMLNNNYSLEPRLGMRWQFQDKQCLSAGLGLHSKLESISTYMASGFNNEGEEHHPNKDLELTKAAHFVVGYEYQFSNNLHFKSEVYYQHLYDVPVENDPNSLFSLSNSSQGSISKDLVNKGKGRNYGMELTFERFFSNNFYYLATASIYKSTYTAMDGIERNSRYDANYAGNFLFGKEFVLSSKKNNKTIGINSKLCLLGAERYTPIDLFASNQIRETVYDKDNILALKGEDVIYLNLGITYRVDRKKTTHEFKIDIQNITNEQAMISEYYNEYTKKIEKGNQLPMIPNIIYTIKF